MHATVRHRKALSAPARYLVNTDLPESTILDYGCGAGVDVVSLCELGYTAIGYDPNTPEFSTLPKEKFQAVFCTYVLNVVKNPEKILLEAWDCVAPDGILAITCRSEYEISRAAKCSNWEPSGNGWVTGSGSYQEGYSMEKLSEMLISLPGNSFVTCHKVNGNPLVIVNKSLGTEVY